MVRLRFALLALAVVGVLGAATAFAITSATGSDPRAIGPVAPGITTTTVTPFVPAKVPAYEPPPECLDPSPTMIWVDIRTHENVMIERAEFCRLNELYAPPGNSTLGMSSVVADGKVVFLYYRNIRTVSGHSESVRQGARVLFADAQRIIADERRQNAEVAD